jgi:2'-5' RNA ligase
MRLFVAVDLDDETRAAAGRITDVLRSELARSASTATVTWVNPDRMHLTLQFIGEVSEAIAHDVAGRLRSGFDMSPFELSFGAVGIFPPSGRPRVIWLGVERGMEPLAALQLQMVRRLDGVPFRRESREFSPHLTLGRVKDGATRADRDRIASARVAGAGRCIVEHVTLYQSRLSPRGPSYTPVLVTPLVQERHT